jgi:hypothetical protein
MQGEIMDFIEVNCEYQFSNQGGGYSEILQVDENLSQLEIEALVYAHLVDRSGNTHLQDDDYNWSYVDLMQLVKE